MRPCVRRASPVVYRVKRTILNLSIPTWTTAPTHNTHILVVCVHENLII